MPDSYNTIENVLRERLREHPSDFLRVSADQGELLLLVTAFDVAGFVVLRRRATETYDATYKRFKALYRQNQSKWRGKTLSFVLCTVAETDANPSFLSKLEMDVYFCKKYIIQHNDDPKMLHSEVLRLPFVPLADDAPGGISRPPSAQTLLQSSGVEANLAQKLIVPGKYSAQRIIDEIERGEQELNELQNRPVTAGDSQLLRPEPTRVTSLSIQGFRAYKEECEFDLDADIVVLFGPNGLGKTSFFDALDFVCTGRIGHLCPGRIAPDRFINFARHLDTPPNFGKVTLRTNSGSKQTEYVRHVDDWNSGYVMDEHLDRTALLQRLTSANWPEKKPRIENLEKLFRATHLFSQTDSELFSNFSTNSDIPADLVARMLALDDYASGLRKIDQLGTIVRKRLEKLSDQANSITIMIKELRGKQASLGVGEAKQFSGESAKRIAEEIRNTTLDMPDLDLSESLLTTGLAREWRGLLHARADQTRMRLTQTTKLHDELQEVQATEKAEQECNQSLERLAERENENRERHALTNKEIKTTRSKIHELEQKTEKVKELRSSISEAKVLRMELPAKAAEKEQLVERIKASEERLSDITSGLERADSALAELNKNRRSMAKLIPATKSRQEDLAALISSAKDWEEDGKKSKELLTSKKSLQIRQATTVQKRKEAQEKFNKSNVELATAEREYKRVTEDVSDLTELLDRIEQYVMANTCPLCGMDHISKDSLLSAIQSQKKTRPARVETVAKTVNELTTVRKHHEIAIERLRNEEADIETSIREASEALHAISDRASTFQTAAKILGLDQSSPSFSQEIEAAAHNTESEVKRALTSSVTQERKRGEIGAERTQLIEQREQLDEVLKQARNRLEIVKNNQQDLRRKITGAGIPEDASDTDILALIQVQEDRLKAIEDSMVGLGKLHSKREHELAELEATNEQLIADKNILQKRNKSAARRIEKFRNELQSIGLPSDATDEQLRKRISELTLNLKNLEATEEKARFLETLLDNAAKSAALAETESRLKDATDKLEKIKTTKSTLLKSRRWFATTKEILSNKQKEAVADHIRAYGPLTTIIQKRLRTAYGFGDISLQPKKDEIHIGVSWGTEFLPPTDYFSESQKQILMLSLFLAGRLTQTWSGFSPILMDDPVTHFDDLNAYAFVELLRGLVESDSTHSQFFVSTCEERLFSLMQEKLSQINGRSKFYQFQAMSREGPVVVPV